MSYYDSVYVEVCMHRYFFLFFERSNCPLTRSHHINHEPLCAWRDKGRACVWMRVCVYVWVWVRACVHMRVCIMYSDKRLSRGFLIQIYSMAAAACHL